MSVTTAVAAVSDAVRGEEEPDPQVSERAKRRTYSAKYKAKILAEYERLDRDGKGALLRREGLYSSLISEWRKQRDKGALSFPRFAGHLIICPDPDRGDRGPGGHDGRPEEQTPSPANRERIAAAYAALRTDRVDRAQGAARSARHDLVSELNQALRARYRQEIRLTDIRSLRFE